ncbi:MAG: ATP-dependent Clp protease ATP-binding subunit [Bacilli bacterium]|nr:ATP-dependent Clp protease ATP-binding subunit [Bacilli bacterium]
MKDVTENFIDIFDDSSKEDIFPTEVLTTEEEKKDTNKLSILNTYSEDMTAKTYVTNPAISRDEEIKKLILILLSPEKSPVLTGKAGIGKTAIVEGLSYRIQTRTVPDALLNCKIYKINTSSLLGTYEHDGIEESKLQLLINEILGNKNIILFIDEIHTLVTSARSGGVDFLNMLKPGLDRGDIKIIGATTTQEFNEFLLKDKAFLRRFEKIEVEEPDQETTVKILMGTKRKIEVATGVTFPYTDFILEQVCKFIVNMTSEYKRIYEHGSRYPDVSLSLFSKCFSYAKFENSKYVTFKYIYQAIKETNLVYDDVVKKELPIFKETFKDWLDKEGVNVEI